jgi:hypothetical protein
LRACCASQAAVACFVQPARWTYTHGPLTTWPAKLTSLLTPAV